MKAVITGHHGYIGPYLYERLLRKENFRIDDILLLDIKSGADITVNTNIDRLFRFKPDIIFHLAALTSVDDSFNDPLETFRTNTFGTYNILRFKASKIIFPSSATVYGNAISAREDYGPHPQSPYAASKAAAEHIIRYSGNPYVILRLGNVYGRKPTRLIKALKGGGKIFGEGIHTRDYVHVDDVVDAMIEAIDWPNNTYNIGTGVQTSVNEVANTMKVKKKYAPAKEEQEYISLNTRRAFQQGWAPKRNLCDFLESL